MALALSLCPQTFSAYRLIHISPLPNTDSFHDIPQNRPMPASTFPHSRLSPTTETQVLYIRATQSPTQTRTACNPHSITISGMPRGSATSLLLFTPTLCFPSYAFPVESFCCCTPTNSGHHHQTHHLQCTRSYIPCTVLPSTHMHNLSTNSAVLHNFNETETH